MYESSCCFASLPALGFVCFLDFSYSGVGDGQGGLACCDSWGRRVGHDWATELNWIGVWWHFMVVICNSLLIKGWLVSFHIAYLPSGISSVYNEVSVQIFGPFFNESIVYLQCCVCFRCTTKWFSYTYICIFFFQIFFPCRLLQNIEYTSLYYTVGPFWLSILDTVVCVYVNPKHLIYPPSSLITISLFSMSVGLFLFCI